MGEGVWLTGVGAQPRLPGMERRGRWSAAILQEGCALPSRAAMLSLVWTVFFAVSAAGYGGIWREIPGDTGRYLEIPGDTRRYEIRADTGRTGRYGEIRGDARRCKEIRGDTVRYWRDTSRYRKKPSALVGLQHPASPAGRGRRRRHSCWLSKCPECLSQTLTRSRRSQTCPSRDAPGPRRCCR